MSLIGRNEGTHFPDPEREVPKEQGYPEDTPPPLKASPPGLGRLVFPHYLSFSQVVNWASRTYRYAFDEALRHSEQNAKACRRDPVIMDALRQRQTPTVQLPWHLEAEDENDSHQAEAVEAITDVIRHIPRWQQLLMHLQERLWFGRYGVQLVYAWDFSTGRKRLLVRDHRPINGDKLVFRYSGQAGVLVHATYPGSWEISERGRAHFFTPREREQLIIGRFEPEDADFFEPELGGGVNGVGIRSRVYWYWFLKYQLTGFMMDFLERVGAGGLTIYFYEAGNQKSLEEVKAAAEQQHVNNTILFPRYRDSSTGGPGVERVEPSNAGAELIRALVTQYFDGVIRGYILGDAESENAQGGGIGSGISDLLAGNLGRRIKYDAVDLADILTTDLVSVIQRYMYPGIPPLRFAFDIDKPNSAELMEAAKTFWDLGGSLDEDSLREGIGLAKPEPGHSMLAKMGSMSPAAANSLPQGTPMLGTPGPEAGGGAMPPDAAQGQPPLAPDGSVPVQAPGMPVVMQKKGERVKLAAGEEDKVLQAHPVPLRHANAYLDKVGLPRHTEYARYLPVNEARSRKAAQVYASLKHAPQDPKVRAAYETFRKEVLAQYRHLQQAGVRMEPWEREGQPYRNSQEMAEDARKGHLFYYLGGEFPKGHLMSEVAVTEGGKPRTYNDLFRAVHDYFGHAIYGNQFGPRGEEHAYRTHARMFSPAARPALAAETRGQNSFVNFGPHSHLPVTERPYAEQKNALMPEDLLGD